MHRRAGATAEPGDVGGTETQNTGSQPCGARDTGSPPPGGLDICPQRSRDISAEAQGHHMAHPAGQDHCRTPDPGKCPLRDLQAQVPGKGQEAGVAAAATNLVRIGASISRTRSFQRAAPAGGSPRALPRARHRAAHSQYLLPQTKRAVASQQPCAGKGSLPPSLPSQAGPCQRRKGAQPDPTR